MKNDRTYISFDWALKRLLRDKANFDVLEGFLSTLLETNIKIHRLLESEGNKERDDSKYNRVDLLAENAKGELILIEVQGEPEFAYFQQMLFGASKLVTEYIEGGNNYDNVKKVYSVNIVYFNLGQGQDVVYHGKTEFKGIHTNEILQLSPFQKQKFAVDEVFQLYPEYYILKVNDFNRWSRIPLEQWLYFLSTSEIPDDADAPGLPEAREKLQLIRMKREEQLAYDSYMMDRAILRNTMITAVGEGRLEGIAEGREQGRKEGREEGIKQGLEQGIQQGKAEGISETNRKHAKKMLKLGVPIATISEVTGLSRDEIDGLINTSNC